ncbi:hypothetical protein [Streptomyces chartreusis]
MLVDRQVGVLLVASDVGVGQLDDAGQGQGIETDEGSCDAEVQGQRRVVEAAQQLVSSLGPADITRALLFHTSDDASFATGSEFAIDGGLLLGPALKHEAA